MPSQEHKSKKHEATEREIGSREKEMREIGNRLLNDWKISETKLSREQRHELQKSRAPEDIERLKEYQFNKKRKNWFMTLQMFLGNALDNGFLNVENREGLKKEKQDFFEEVSKVEFGAGEEPSDELIQKGNELLRKILEKE